MGWDNRAGFAAESVHVRGVQLAGLLSFMLSLAFLLPSVRPVDELFQVRGELCSFRGVAAELAHYLAHVFFRCDLGFTAIASREVSDLQGP